MRIFLNRILLCLGYKLADILENHLALPTLAENF